MNNMVLNLIDNTVSTARKNADFCEEDYRDSRGLLICGKCHTPREAILKLSKTSVFYERYKNHPFPVLCKCRKEHEEAENRRIKQLETEMCIGRFRKEGITDKSYLQYTFDHDDNKNPEISRACKKYADNFADMCRLGKGLMFCGQVGTGKTFYAGCIANAVLAQARSVLMTNIPSLMTRIGYNQEERIYMLNKIANVSLLVIDDLGVERDTSYSLEKIYEIIDTRYRSGKPLIITTNLRYKDLSSCENMSYRRIYDRILQMCHPIAVIGESRRSAKIRESSKFMNDFLGLNQKQVGEAIGRD